MSTDLLWQREFNWDVRKVFNTKKIPKHFLEVTMSTLKYLHVGDSVRYVSPFTHQTIVGVILYITEDGAIRVRYKTKTGYAYITCYEDSLERV